MRERGAAGPAVSFVLCAAASVAASGSALAWLERPGMEQAPATPGSLRGVDPYLASAAVLGFSALAADAAWVSAGQYFGDGAYYPEGWKRYGVLARQALTLAPHWTRGYEYAALALGWVLHRPTEASQLLRRGLQENPTHGRFGRYLAGLVATKGRDDEGLLAILQQLTQDPGHPALLDRTLALLYEKRGMRPQAIEAWRRVALNSLEPGSRRIAIEHLKLLGAPWGG